MRIYIEFRRVTQSPVTRSARLLRGLPPRLPLSCLGDGTRAPVVVVPIPVRARETASSLRTRSEKDRFFRSARSERFAQTGLGTHPRKSGETGPGPIDSGQSGGTIDGKGRSTAKTIDGKIVDPGSGASVRYNRGLYTIIYRVSGYVQDGRRQRRQRRQRRENSSGVYWLLLYVYNKVQGRGAWWCAGVGVDGCSFVS